MPNHVRNLLVIDTLDEQELRNIEDFMKGVDDENGRANALSFQQIRPCPQELLPENTENGAQLQEPLTEEEIRRRKTLYGAADWYSWRWENWGTKWDCYEVAHEPMSGSYEFTTAWNTPLALIKYLSQKFPISIFQVQYADEDLGQNCGTYSIKNGQITDSTNGDLFLACEIWGYSYAEELEARSEDSSTEEEDIEEARHYQETHSSPAMCPECGSKSTWSNSSGELQCDNCGFSETE